MGHGSECRAVCLFCPLCIAVKVWTHEYQGPRDRRCNECRWPMLEVTQDNQAACTRMMLRNTLRLDATPMGRRDN